MKTITTKQAGRKGGKNSRKNMSPEAASEMARTAAKARWAKRCETCGTFHSKGSPCDTVARQFIEEISE